MVKKKKKKKKSSPLSPQAALPPNQLAALTAAGVGAGWRLWAVNEVKVGTKAELVKEFGKLKEQCSGGDRTCVVTFLPPPSAPPEDLRRVGLGDGHVLTAKNNAKAKKVKGNDGSEKEKGGGGSKEDDVGGEAELNDGDDASLLSPPGVPTPLTLLRGLAPSLTKAIQQHRALSKEAEGASLAGGWAASEDSSAKEEAGGGGGVENGGIGGGVDGSGQSGDIDGEEEEEEEEEQPSLPAGSAPTQPARCFDRGRGGGRVAALGRERSKGGHESRAG
mmetsp:Transcript_6614/g.12314  ORF Transcript_6614/g.12314 Transcript_6614/m.12314 type:complete len:276 (-) Transcript_6614:231-1058(-)